MLDTSLLVAVYLPIINAATYFAFWIDKSQARQGGYRISEATLLLLSFLGGSPAAIFARYFLRHKTRKQPFTWQLFVIVAAQFCAVIWLMALRLFPSASSNSTMG
jgi:uncharacterized membrane protein YsdA (DUF1294 family)